MGFPHLPYPLVNIQKAIEAMAIEIVDLPISMVMFHGFLLTFTLPGSLPGRNQQAPLPPRQVDDARERVQGTSTCAEQISQRHRQPGMDQRIKADRPCRRRRLYPLANKQLDPENSQFLMETNLPTPMNGRVYVNLLKGKHW